MEISIQNWIVSSKDELTQIELLSGAGFKYADWDLGPYFNKNENLNVSSEDVTNYYTKLKQQCDKCGLDIYMTHSIYPTYMDENNKDDLLYRLDKNFLASNLLGAKYMVVHPMIPKKWEGESFRKERVEKNIQFYNTIQPLAQKYNVVVCIENLYGSLSGFGTYNETTCSSISEMQQVFDGITDKQYFGFCYDSGHARLTLHEQHPDMAKQLGSNIKVVHLHGNNQKFDLHLRPTKDNLNWDAVMKNLKDCGFNGVYNFEIIPIYTIGFNTAKKLRKLHDYLQEFLKKYE